MTNDEEFNLELLQISVVKQSLQFLDTGIRNVQVDYYFAHLKVTWDSDDGVCATPYKFLITASISDGRTFRFRVANTEREYYVVLRDCSNAEVTVEKVDVNDMPFGASESITTPQLETSGKCKF